MTIKEPGLTALRVTYAAIRTPWDLLNEQVVARVFGAESTAHRTLTQGLQTIDALAQQAFSTCADERFDVDETDEDERAETIEVPPAGDEPKPTDVRDEQPIDRDEQQQISDLADRYLAEDQLGNRAGELAEDDEVRRAQAEIRAKQTIEDERGQL